MRHLKNIKVYTEDLLPGLFVASLDCRWEDSRFLMQGFKIESISDIDSLREQCKFVYVDFESDAQFKEFKLKTTKSSSYKEHLEKGSGTQLEQFKNDIKPAISRRRKTNQLIKTLLDDIAFGRDFDLVAVRSTVKKNVKQILENADAMLMMNMLRNHSEDIAQHSLNVSIMAIAFAHSLGYSEIELEDIGMAGLLHDVGLAKVNPQVVNKHGKLNHEQQKDVQKHCQFGFDIISGKSGLTPSCIDVAISHHEQLDGRGYPRGLTKQSITKNIRIISILDVYDTLSNYQIYAKVSPVLISYKEMMKSKNIMFDEKLLLKFIKWRSIYPPGAIVEMKSGEVGIIIGSNKSRRLNPRVMLVLDEYKQPSKEQIIDLTKPVLNSNGEEYKIKNSFENTAFGIDIQHYLAKGLVINP